MRAAAQGTRRTRSHRARRAQQRLGRHIGSAAWRCGGAGAPLCARAGAAARRAAFLARPGGRQGRSERAARADAQGVRLAPGEGAQVPRRERAALPRDHACGGSACVGRGARRDGAQASRATGSAGPQAPAPVHTAGRARSAQVGTLLPRERAGGQGALDRRHRGVRRLAEHHSRRRVCAHQPGQLPQGAVQLATSDGGLFGSDRRREARHGQAGAAAPRLLPQQPRRLAPRLARLRLGLRRVHLRACLQPQLPHRLEEPSQRALPHRRTKPRSAAAAAAAQIALFRLPHCHGPGLARGEGFFPRRGGAHSGGAADPQYLRGLHGRRSRPPALQALTRSVAALQARCRSRRTYHR
mmetsp:Transcript_195/g.516  ORF Transcript_195/g.516 Transcript_195/m.516 type:complete len:355 (-) Transcript_195:52-1116(-)